MENNTKRVISVHTTVRKPLEKVWKNYTSPDDIVKWNAASSDWHTTHATNDLRIGGQFNYRMEAKDGSFGFDFWGVYDEIKSYEKLEYTLGDGRKVLVKFLSLGNQTEILQTFEPENENSDEMQLNGWQSILNNFKEFAEKY